ncbi:hypothetical protein BD408DRAFT_464611 [Parasitella parasitica]|nr:hypothetical protein BD408DRAFT_464611 [Parasitella parasitica]
MFSFLMFVVGSSTSRKRKQTQETKNDKKKAKLGERSSSNQSDDVICVKCKQPGHVNGRSALCTERAERKSDVLKDIWVLIIECFQGEYRSIKL